jgi:hypothetical protein
MEGRKTSKSKFSSESEENESFEEEPQKSEEEEKYSNKEASESEDDLYHMKLRKTKATRSTYSLRTDRRTAKATRGKKGVTKRKRTTIVRGRKKPKAAFEGIDYQAKPENSESEESYTQPEFEADNNVPVAEKFLYKPGIPWPDLTPYLQQLIEIRIAREFIGPYNRQVINQQLWGNDVYTSDSDIVASLHHVGLLNIWQPLPPQYEGVSVLARVTKGRTNYVSSLRNGIKSKKCVNYEGHSIKPERIMYLNSLGKLEELIEMAEKMPTDYPKIRTKPSINPKATRIVPGTHVVFDLSFEPAVPFNLNNFGDKGWDEASYLSSKLRKSVVYLETKNKRYELSQVLDDVTQTDSNEEEIFEKPDKYRWAEVKSPLMTKDSAFMSAQKIPLEDALVSSIHDDLDWSEIQFSSTSIFIRDVEYGPLKCFKFNSIYS